MLISAAITAKQESIEFAMKDQPATPRPQRLLDASQTFPSAEIFSDAPVGLCVLDEMLRFVYINDWLAAINGLSVKEHLGRTIGEVLPDVAARIESQLLYVIETGKPILEGTVSGETPAQSKVKRHFQHNYRAVKSNDGTVVGVSCAVLDVTRRKRAEDAHRIEQDLLNALDSTPDDTVYVDVLRILLDFFRSQAGLFLRFAKDESLFGPYLSASEQQIVRCPPTNQCELWDTALRGETAVIENSPRWMGCGKLISRSLVAPIRHDGVLLGMFHIGDSQADYDAADQDFLTRISSMVAPVVSARMEHDKLTSREAEVMDLIISGKTQKQIAAALAVSIQTAAKHRAKVLDKLHVYNDVELVHFASRMRNPAA